MRFLGCARSALLQHLHSVPMHLYWVERRVQVPQLRPKAGVGNVRRFDSDAFKYLCCLASAESLQERRWVDASGEVLSLAHDLQSQTRREHKYADVIRS
ncbi:hypothetical protein ASG45_13640 [Microbacterium sp. Leaf436]|nr:hypothetical protein ASG45_13640 [Microbacterium sp. Leaf436]